MGKKLVVGQNPKWVVPSIRVVGLNRDRGVVVTVRHVDRERRKKILADIVEYLQSTAENEGLEFIVEGVNK